MNANTELPLTQRQREMLAALAKGLDNADLSDLMQISERTVQNEVSEIIRKLGVNNRAQAVAMYLLPRLDVRKPAEPMVNLDRFPTYAIGDQPETCRACGRRTEFVEVGKLQLHACDVCMAAFLIEAY